MNRESPVRKPASQAVFSLGYIQALSKNEAQDLGLDRTGKPLLRAEDGG